MVLGFLHQERAKRLAELTNGDTAGSLCAFQDAGCDRIADALVGKRKQGSLGRAVETVAIAIHTHTMAYEGERLIGIDFPGLEFVNLMRRDLNQIVGGLASCWSQEQHYSPVAADHLVEDVEGMDVDPGEIVVDNQATVVIGCCFLPHPLRNLVQAVILLVWRWIDLVLQKLEAVVALPGNLR